MPLNKYNKIITENQIKAILSASALGTMSTVTTVVTVCGALRV